MLLSIYYEVVFVVFFLVLCFFWGYIVKFLFVIGFCIQQWDVEVIFEINYIFLRVSVLSGGYVCIYVLVYVFYSVNQIIKVDKIMRFLFE